MQTFEGWIGKAKCLMLIYLEGFHVVLHDFQKCICFSNWMQFSEDILIKRQYGLRCMEHVINCSHAYWQSLGLECVNLFIFYLQAQF